MSGAVTAHRRVPPGTPSGGEFASQPHGEAELSAPLVAPSPASRLRSFVEANQHRLVPGCENIAWDLGRGETLLVERSFGTNTLRLSLHSDSTAAIGSRDPVVDSEWIVQSVHDLATGDVLDERAVQQIEAQGGAR